MKVTQYTTSALAHFAKRSLDPWENPSGIKAFCRSERAEPSDFLGFGVAITASSCYNLSRMPGDERRAALTDIFGEGGLGLRVGRLTIGSSDYSPELYSYDDADGDVTLKHFSVDRDKEFVIPVIQEILSINPELYLYASPWSPPAWMKTGGSLCGGSMRAEFIDIYAEYIVRFIKEYEDNGIKISALTPQNEPETDQGGRMPACIWSAEDEARFVTVLKGKLNERGLQVEILIHDHNFSGWKRALGMLEAHPELSSSCDGIAFHYYEGAIEDTVRLRELYPELSLHFTEGGPRLYDNYGTDWCKWGMIFAKLMNCGYKSFTGWNLMLDEMGGPKIGPFSCGGLITRNSETNALTYSGQYRALMHFSKFIKGGASICPVDQQAYRAPMSNFKNCSDIPLQLGAAVNEDGSVCYFIVNAEPRDRELGLVENNRFYRVKMPPESVATVVFEGE